MWIVLLFFMSLFAWMKGDDSMKWVVIIGIALYVCACLFGSCG